MPRFTNMVVMYFVIGAVLFGGGAVTWDDSGVTQYFVDQGDHGGVETDNTPTNKLSGLAGAITSLVGQFGGPIVLVWNLVVGLASFLHWPVTVLIENHAPPRVTLLLGGSLQAAFYMSLVVLVRSSA